MTAPNATFGTAGSNPTAVVGRRIGAWVIDLLIYLAIGAAVTAAFGNMQTFQGFEKANGQGEAKVQADRFCKTGDAPDGVRYNDINPDRCWVIDGGDEAIVIAGDPTPNALYWLIHLIGYGILSGLLGGSIGKLIVGLRVVDANGNKAGVLKNVLRTVLWIADAVTCGFPIVGGVMMVSTKGHRRLGDMAAGTYVVDKGSVGRPIAAEVDQPTFGAAGRAVDEGWVPGTGSGPPAWPDHSASTTAAPSAATTASTTPGADAPSWDEARSAYIQYDRDLEAWMQWDDIVKKWKPISQ